MKNRPRLRAMTMLLGLSALGAGCRGFEPVRDETLARLQPMLLAELLPGRFELELTSPGLSGTFDAICVVEAQRCRLQLFPDVGGKLLDLELNGDTVTADLAGSRYEAHAPLDQAAPHLALVLAAVLGELLAPIAAERVTGERCTADGGVEVRLRPALGSGSVTARLHHSGRVERYTIVLGWLSFSLADDGNLQGRGFSGRLGALAGG